MPEYGYCPICGVKVVERVVDNHCTYLDDRCRCANGHWFPTHQAKNSPIPDMGDIFISGRRSGKTAMQNELYTYMMKDVISKEQIYDTFGMFPSNSNYNHERMEYNVGIKEGTRVLVGPDFAMAGGVGVIVGTSMTELGKIVVEPYTDEIIAPNYPEGSLHPIPAGEYLEHAFVVFQRTPEEKIHSLMVAADEIRTLNQRKKGAFNHGPWTEDDEMALLYAVIEAGRNNF